MMEGCYMWSVQSSTAVRLKLETSGSVEQKLRSPTGGYSLPGLCQAHLTVFPDGITRRKDALAIPGDVRPTASYGLPSPALQVLLMRKACVRSDTVVPPLFCAQATGAGLEAPKETNQQTVALPFGIDDVLCSDFGLAAQTDKPGNANCQSWRVHLLVLPVNM